MSVKLGVEVARGMEMPSGSRSPATLFWATSKRLPRPCRIATVMRFVRLLEIFSNRAHACLAQAPEAWEGWSEHHLRNDAGAGVHAHPAGTAAAAQDDRDAGLQSCFSVCELQQSIVVKSRPAQADAGADSGMPAPAGLGTWPTQTPGRAEPRWPLDIRDRHDGLSRPADR